MANAIVVDKRLVLEYEDGSFSFNKLDAQAGSAALYQLAHILNSFQAERPPLKISCVTRSQIL